MTINNFIDSINKSTYDRIQGIMECAINDFSKVDNYKSITTKIKGLDAKDFTVFGDKVSECIHICKAKLIALQGVTDNSYLSKLNSFLVFLNELNSIIISEGNARREKQRKIADNEDKSYVKAQNLEVLQEQINKLNLVQKSANDALDQIKNIRSELDSKIFSLLINTVAILGIFVAIAFTGFGVMSIFSNINLAVSLESTAAYLKNVFYLLMVTLVSYNLLLILIYFIFKLSRPLFVKPQVDKTDDKQNEKSVEQKNFMQSVNLTPFLWIDRIMFLLTIVMFVCCLIFT